MGARSRPDPDDLDDLLQPSLGEQHEGRGFDRPYQPNAMVLVAFFAGPLLGGWLVARNFARLGIHGKFGVWMTVFTITWLLTVCLTSFVLADPFETARRVTGQQVTEPRGQDNGNQSSFESEHKGNSTVGLGGPDHDPDAAKPSEARENSLQRRGLRWLVRLLGLIPAFVAAHQQRRRYAIYEMTGADPASALKIGIGLFVANLALSVVLSFALAAVVIALA